MKEILEDRMLELQKHSLSISQQPELLQASSFERPHIMKELSRLALGLEPQYDIADMPPNQRAEVLLIISGVGDRLIQK
jgi:hypothetical protein